VGSRVNKGIEGTPVTESSGRDTGEGWLRPMDYVTG